MAWSMAEEGLAIGDGRSMYQWPPVIAEREPVMMMMMRRLHSMVMDGRRDWCSYGEKM
jgi:hypothetical protein